MKGVFQAKNIFKIKEIREYAYLVLFLFICSFFVIFVIRPNLKQIVLAKKKVEDLKLIKDEYDKVINKIIEFQSNFEQFRDKYYLINEAIPHLPAVNKILVDIDSKAKANDLEIERLIINDLNLLSVEDQDVNDVKINLTILGKFNDFNQFIKSLTNQRRLKEIKSFKISRSKESEATESGKLDIDLVISSYYL